MTQTASPSAASKAFFLVAIALGVLATILAFAYINSNAGVSSGPKRSIIVASHDIAANATLDPTRDLKAISVPLDFAALSQLTLDPASQGNYRGLRVNRAIPGGQPIFIADISAYEPWEPAGNMRGFPILAEPGIAVPGDYVKVLISRPDMTAAAAGNDPNRGSYLASYAARGAVCRVIAVGNNMRQPRNAVMTSDLGGSSSGGGSAPKIVTLECTEQQAAEILGALGGGIQKATLVICPPPAEGATRPN